MHCFEDSLYCVFTKYRNFTEISGTMRINRMVTIFEKSKLGWQTPIPEISEIFVKISDTGPNTNLTEI